MKKTTFTLLLLIFSNTYSSNITVGESCVVNNLNDNCSTTISVENTSNKKLCLWRKASNGKPLKIFACHDFGNATWSKIWTETSTTPDDFELKSHNSWPTQDPLGLAHAYNLGSLISTKTVVAEYGKISVPSVCTLQNGSESCSTEFFVNRKGQKRVCLWRAPSNGKSLKIFACHASSIPSWSKVWTETSSVPDDFEFMFHEIWPTQDPLGLPHAYSMGVLLDTKTIVANTQQTTIDPVIISANAACANNFCVTVRGTNFDNNASVKVRENQTGSTTTVFSGNNIYNRFFSSTEDRIFFPIQNIVLQNKWSNNGICLMVNSNGNLSNEICINRPPTPTQPKFLGQTVESYQNQDIEHTSWIVKGSASPLQGGNLLKIWGNSWKNINYNYTVTPNTVLKFDFRANQQQAEINGIGFTLQNGARKHFQVFGTQLWGYQDYHNYSGTGFKSYEIPIGTYFQGVITNMFFTADEDTHVGQNVAFRNPILEEASTPSPSGWDYGLKTHRIKSNVDFDGNGLADDYVDFIDSSSRNYIIGIQNEQGFGSGCPGPNGLSYLPNQGPSTINWINNGNGYTVEMKTNQYGYHENCKQDGSNMFTWFSFLDKNSTTYPHPMKTIMSMDVYYNEYNTGGSAGRFILGMDIVTEGIWYEIEINGYMAAWENNDVEIVKVYEGNNKKFINLNGAFFGLNIPLNQWTSISYDWEPVLQWLIDRNYIPSSIKTNPSLKPSFVIAIENLSKSKSGKGSGVTHLKFKNLHYDAKN